MIESLRLALDFDPCELQTDLARIPSDRWIAHFNKRDYEGDWSAVGLRGPAGATHPVQAIFATPGIKDWANTDLLDICPYFAEVLSRFECPLQSVRLLRLAPNAVIKQHTDHSLSLEDGELRMHVPVQTNSGVEFILNDKRLTLQEGETWYLNVNLPHSLVNRGSAHRVHLIADCTVNAWLRELIDTSGG